MIFSSESDDEMSKPEFWEKKHQKYKLTSTKNAISAFHASRIEICIEGRIDIESLDQNSREIFWQSEKERREKVQSKCT